MKYLQLTEGTKYQIALLFGEKISLTEISSVLVLASPQYPERSGGRVWLAIIRQQKLSSYVKPSGGRAAKYSISSNTVLYVETGLCWKWSPEQISAICKRIGSPVSHE